MKKPGQINKYRFIFLEIGLILALSFSLMAFKIEGSKTNFLEEDVHEEEFVNIMSTYTPAPKKKKEEKKPILKKRKHIIDDLRNIKLVDNKIKIIEPKKIAAEPLKIGPANFVSKPIIDPDALVEFPDQNPEFPGGQEALSKFLGKNLSYPDLYVKQEKEGVVVVSFVVDQEGEITDVKIVRNNVGYQCDRVVMEVIKKMPKWIPAMKNGVKVKTKFYQRIRFELDY